MPDKKAVKLEEVSTSTNSSSEPEIVDLLDPNTKKELIETKHPECKSLIDLISSKKTKDGSYQFAQLLSDLYDIVGLEQDALNFYDINGTEKTFNKIREVLINPEKLKIGQIEDKDLQKKLEEIEKTLPKLKTGQQNKKNAEEFFSKLKELDKRAQEFNEQYFKTFVKIVSADPKEQNKLFKSKDDEIVFYQLVDYIDEIKNTSLFNNLEISKKDCEEITKKFNENCEYLINKIEEYKKTVKQDQIKTLKSLGELQNEIKELKGQKGLFNNVQFKQKKKGIRTIDVLDSKDFMECLSENFDTLKKHFEKFTNIEYSSIGMAVGARRANSIYAGNDPAIASFVTACCQFNDGKLNEATFKDAISKIDGLSDKKLEGMLEQHNGILIHSGIECWGLENTDQITKKISEKTLGSKEIDKITKNISTLAHLSAFGEHKQRILNTENKRTFEEVRSCFISSEDQKPIQVFDPSVRLSKNRDNDYTLIYNGGKKTKLKINEGDIGKIVYSMGTNGTGFITAKLEIDIQRGIEEAKDTDSIVNNPGVFIEDFLKKHKTEEKIMKESGSNLYELTGFDDKEQLKKYLERCAKEIAIGKESKTMERNTLYLGPKNEPKQKAEQRQTTDLLTPFRNATTTPNNAPYTKLLAEADKDKGTSSKDESKHELRRVKSCSHF